MCGCCCCRWCLIGVGVIVDVVGAAVGVGGGVVDVFFLFCCPTYLDAATRNIILVSKNKKSPRPRGAADCASLYLRSMRSNVAVSTMLA